MVKLQIFLTAAFYAFSTISIPNEDLYILRYRSPNHGAIFSTWLLLLDPYFYFNLSLFACVEQFVDIKNNVLVISNLVTRAEVRTKDPSTKIAPSFFVACGRRWD